MEARLLLRQQEGVGSFLLFARSYDAYQVTSEDAGIGYHQLRKFLEGLRVPCGHCSLAVRSNIRHNERLPVPTLTLTLIVAMGFVYLNLALGPM